MLELVSDIDKINNLMHYYKQRDSAAFLVITNQVSEEDYEKNEIPTLSSITSFHNRVDLTQDGYSLLTQNMDIIPDEYKSVLKYLTRIYKVDKRWVDTFDQEMGDVEHSNADRDRKYAQPEQNAEWPCHRIQSLLQAPDG